MINIFSLFVCCALTLAQNPLADKMVGTIPTAHKATLTQALGEIGMRVQDGFTSFGVVVDAPEPLVEVYLPQATSLDDAIQRIVSQVPGYTYEAVSAHVIDVYPSSIRSDPNHPLNLRVANLQLTGITAIDLFSNPSRYIPELRTWPDRDNPQARGSLGPGLGSESSAVIRLDLHNVTIKQVLDAAAMADSTQPSLATTRTQPPTGWVFQRDTDPTTGKRNDKWSFMVTVPRNWRSFLSQ